MAIKTFMTNLTPRRQQYKKVITLMSHGFSNPSAWPNGNLTVYPWDSMVDNFLIESRKSGSPAVLFDLIEKVCDLNGGTVDELVADEVNVILLVSRALASDNVIGYTSVCPFCGNKASEQIVVPDNLEKVAEKPSNYPGYDLITLPTCKDVVAIRPLLVRDEKLVLSRSAEDRASVNDTELRQVLPIVTINDSKPEALEELMTWYRALSPKDLKYIVEQEKNLTPHLNTLLPHHCDNSSCGRDFNHLLTFDQDFFR